MLQDDVRQDGGLGQLPHQDVEVGGGWGRDVRLGPTPGRPRRRQVVLTDAESASGGLHGGGSGPQVHLRVTGHVLGGEGPLAQEARGVRRGRLGHHGPQDEEAHNLHRDRHAGLAQGHAGVVHVLGPRSPAVLHHS